MRFTDRIKNIIGIKPLRGWIFRDRLTYLTLPGLLVVLGGLLTSCSDELRFDNGDLDFDKAPGLTICIPHAGGDSFAGTRATDGTYPEGTTATGQVYAEGEEGNFKSLWLVGFRQGDNARTPGVAGPYNLTQYANDNDGKVKVKTDNNYTQYNLNSTLIPEGDYHFYVMANLDDYLDNFTIANISDETTLRGLALDFESYATSNPLQPGVLPMMCLSEDMKTSATGSKIGSDGTVTISNTATGTKLYSEMTFLCAKVRYTLLFDATEGGFSQSFGTRAIDFTLGGDNRPTASKIRNSTPLIYSESADNGTQYDARYIKSGNNINDLWPISLDRVEYPTGEYPVLNNENKTISGNLTPVSDWTNERQRAWQGVIYLPENRLKTTDVGQKVKHFGDQLIRKPDIDYSDNDNIQSYLSFYGTVEGHGEWYSFSLAPLALSQPEGSTGAGVDSYMFNGNGIERGKFYDIVSKVVYYDNPYLEVQMNVADWQTFNIDAYLNGVTELEVETTQLSVSSGEWTEMWYRASVTPEEIRFKYPQYEGKNFYEAEVMTDEDGNYVTDEETGNYKIRIRINPAIPFTTLESLKDANRLSEYNYFEICAGNLVKKIKLDPINIEGFLNVTPQVINIDVREYITSGKGSDVIAIKISSNVSNTISYSCNAVSEGLFTTTNPLWMTYDERTTSRGSGVINITDGEGTLYLNLKNLFTGDSYWKNNYTYSFDFSVGDGEELNKSLTITVKPYSTNYTIHFRSQMPVWSAPHIYIYQCLELPADLTTEEGGTTRHPYAGRTVGYKDEGSYFSALEYLFTRDVAFRGWKGYGGVEENDPYAPYQYNAPSGNDIGTQGFVEFTGYAEKTNPYNPEWDTNGEHYDKAALFNEGANLEACPDCQNYGYRNHQWPGIVMEKETGENEGWWKYTLTGIATPGKAMIMFTDGHGGTDDLDKRYPKGAAVGVPLFDYPDNEGWFDFWSAYTGDNHTDANQNFTDDKPYTFRFYWRAENKESMFISANNRVVFSWSNNYNQYANNWYYVEFTSKSRTADFVYKVNDIYTGNYTSDNNVLINGGLSKFTLGSDGKYYAYVDGNANVLNGGLPNLFEPGDEITVKWDYNSLSAIDDTWKYIYVYSNESDANLYTGTLNGTVYSSTFTYTSPTVERVNFIIRKADGNNWGAGQTNDIGMRYNESGVTFTQSNGKRRWTITLPDSKVSRL